MSEQVTVLEIVKAYLEANGFDGLCSDAIPECCGCRLDDFMPCGGAPDYSGIVPRCIPGIEVACEGSDCDFFEDGPHFHIVPREEKKGGDGE